MSISQITFTEFTGDPTTLPPAGNLGMYAKDSTEGIYIINSSGTVVGPIGAGGGGGTPGGSDTQVQYNSSGSFAGDAGMTYNPTGQPIEAPNPGPELIIGKSGNDFAGIQLGDYTDGTDTTSTLAVAAKNNGYAQVVFGGPSGLVPNVILKWNPSTSLFKFKGYDATWIFESTDGNQYLTINGNTAAAPGQVLLNRPGAGLSISEGSNCKQGTATLSSGTVTVSNTSVTSSSRIFLTIQDPNGGTPGAVYISNITAGTSFDITSTSIVDTSIVAYFITEAI